MRNPNETSPAKASAHTPGPWHLDGPFKILIDMPPNYVEGFMVMNPNLELGESFPIARVTGPAYFGSEDECDSELIANARLIAAAPDLLQIAESAANAFRERISCLKDELLEDFCDADGVSDQIGNYQWLLDRHLAVIARAKGKTA